MKKCKTETTGYYIWYVLTAIALMIVLFVATKSIIDRWFSSEFEESEQYNEMIMNLQLNGKEVSSDGNYIRVKTNTYHYE